MNDELSRRKMLGALGGGGLVLASMKATDNVVLGYGGVGGGTNLEEQDIDPLLMETRSFGGRLTDEERTYHVDENFLWSRRGRTTGDDTPWRTTRRTVGRGAGAVSRHTGAGRAYDRGHRADEVHWNV